MTMTELAAALGITTVGDPIKAKVRAVNALGTSEYSLITIGPEIQSIPGTVGTITATTISTTEINLAWDALYLSSENGNSAITDYKVCRTAGSGAPPTVCVSTAGATTITLTVDDESTNTFGVFAVNVHGESSASSDITAIAKLAPAQMDAIVVTQVGTTVSFTWTAPETNGYPITAYIIEIYKPEVGTQDYVEVHSMCNCAIEP